MKKTLQLFSLCLIIIIAVISTTAFAAAPGDSADPQANSYIWKTTVGIVPLGSGKIEVDFSVTGTAKPMPDIGATHVDIYNATGKCVKTYVYTAPGYEYMIGHNKFSHTASVTYQGVSGQRYYAIVSFYAGEMGVAGGGDSLKSPAIYA